MSKLLSVIFAIALVQASFGQSSNCITTVLSSISTLQQLMPEISYANITVIETEVDEVIQVFESVVSACGLPTAITQDLQSYENMVNEDLSAISPSCYSFVTQNLTQAYSLFEKDVSKLLVRGIPVPAADLLDIYNAYATAMNLCVPASQMVVISSDCVSAAAAFIPTVESQFSQMTFVNASAIDADVNEVEADVDSVLTACNVPAQVATALSTYVNQLEAEINSLPAQCIPYLNTEVPALVTIAKAIEQSGQVTISEILELYGAFTTIESDCA